MRDKTKTVIFRARMRHLSKVFSGILRALGYQKMKNGVHGGIGVRPLVPCVPVW